MCTETIVELNHCLEVRHPPSPSAPAHSPPQDLIRANAHVKTAADLVTKYRKNVQYNLDATRGPPAAQ